MRIRDMLPTSPTWEKGKVPEWAGTVDLWAEMLWRHGNAQEGPVRQIFQDCDGMGWVRLGGELAVLLSTMIEVKHEWLLRDTGLAGYARASAGPWCRMETGIGGGSENQWGEFLLWVPGYTWADVLNVALFRSETTGELFGEVVIEVAQMYPDEIKAELTAMGIAGATPRFIRGIRSFRSGGGYVRR